jgi:hypothetical protein
MVMQAVLWLWLAWRALRADDFVGWKRGSASYGAVVALLILCAAGATIAAGAEIAALTS